MNRALLFFLFVSLLTAKSLSAEPVDSGIQQIRSVPAAVAPTKLTSGQRLQWNYLQGLMRRFNDTTDRSARMTIARDYLSGSSGFKEVMGGDTEFWRSRAIMSLLLDDAKAGREAAEMFLRLAPDQESTGNLRTRLQQRGWVQDGSQKAKLGGNFILGALRLPMVYVEEGSFVMGSASTDGDRANEGPVTKVTLTKPFWIGKYEISRNQWEMVMGQNLGDVEEGALPKVEVTWHEAAEFCERLTTFERAASRLPAGFQYSLPSEAQWAYACRAGTTEDLPGDLDHLAWYAGNSGGQLHPVGEKKSNPWGICNMQGNASEWCLDYYAERLPGGQQTDPLNLIEGGKRVVRGGSFASIAAGCRVTKRGGMNPDEISDKIGFRVVLTRTGK